MAKITMGLVVMLLSAATAFAQSPKDCLALRAYEYEILDYAAQIYHGTPARPKNIVEEYGVTFNISQLPPNYAVPTKIKSFAMENGIEGVVIVADEDVGPEGLVARMLESSEGKRILIVNDSITQYPEMIIKGLLGVTEVQENQTSELRSVVQVGKNEQGWQAKFANALNKGIDKLTGGDLDKSIDYDKIYLEKIGPFDELFDERRLTLEINGYGPYNIEVKPLNFPISYVPGVLANLVQEIRYKNPQEAYSERLYMGDDGRLYSCR